MYQQMKYLKYFLMFFISKMLVVKRNNCEWSRRTEDVFSVLLGKEQLELQCVDVSGWSADWGGESSSLSIQTLQMHEEHKGTVFYSLPAVEEVFRSFTVVKVPIKLCKSKKVKVSISPAWSKST